MAGRHSRAPRKALASQQRRAALRRRLLTTPGPVPARDRRGRTMMRRAASAFAALAASCTLALAHVAPWSSPDPPPLPVQFLVGIALMAVAAGVIAWQGAALARRALLRSALARERERRRANPDRHRESPVASSGQPKQHCLVPIPITSCRALMPCAALVIGGRAASAGLSQACWAGR